MMGQSELLLTRGTDKHRPSVENRVAFQWESGLDTLGYRNATTRDKVILDWMTEAVDAGTGAQAALDVGCGYGNHMLMLNARLGKRADVRLVGVDLYESALDYARSFAATVPGYDNCSFQVADLEQGLPFESGTFDAVNIADVLEHLVDPAKALEELVRITKPGGAIIFSTPLKTSLFKTVASLANRFSKGRINENYYAGKDALIEDGKAVMNVHAGHDHISEMTYDEIKLLVARCRCRVISARMMPIMSGSRWFDRRPFVLAGLLLLEAVHEKLQYPSWAHGVVIRLQTPDRS